MVVPALLFVAINAGGDGARGWGIVMATDIAFVLGLPRAAGAGGSERPAPVPADAWRSFDDIGAIIVIAVFYSSDIDLLAPRRRRRARPRGARGEPGAHLAGPAYLVSGVALWVAMFESGVHPTIAGVILGVLVAVFPPNRGDVERAARLSRSSARHRRPSSRVRRR
jgi:Na+/H+ antiporter NhaA